MDFADKPTSEHVEISEHNKSITRGRPSSLPKEPADRKWIVIASIVISGCCLCYLVRKIT